jgi:TolA-binding protein
MYQQVAERYPHSRQAEAARVAAAALRLEHLDDAEGAASEYRASAARRGQLSEEAAYGLAEAHRASGRLDLEKIQLERFIASYPKSPLVAAARRRLAELEDDERR